MRILLRVLGLLVADLLSTLTFFLALALFENLYAATILAIGVGVVQVVVLRLGGRAVASMQWLSLVLVVVLGGATLFTQNLAIVKFKPSIIYLALGGVMLQRGWMARYVPPEILDELEAGALTSWGYAWAALMILIAVTNLALALKASTTAWAWFASIGANAAQAGLAMVQYLVLRRRVRTSRAAKLDQSPTS
ncbi:septation protein IspZ [uncultured Caulobacter sp.]|uniref:septation protein IspZ n=1 Tax=uncultured Caulobacter sp. TaxID=158749 RepID=UPI00261FDC0D|nr:septation protein IspZ [uncultured Caulobacter sp.]